MAEFNVKTAGQAEDLKTMNMQESLEVQRKKKQECESGNHKFIESDEREKTCLYCGEFQVKTAKKV